MLHGTMESMVSGGVMAPKRRFACKRRERDNFGVIFPEEIILRFHKESIEKHRKPMYIFGKIPAWFPGCGSGFAIDWKYVGAELCSEVTDCETGNLQYRSANCLGFGDIPELFVTLICSI